LNIMFGHKTAETNDPFEVLPSWPWVNPTYEFTLPVSMRKIKTIEIDPSMRLIDINRENNVLEI